MKITINDIYKDNLNLYEDNDFLTGDERLAEFAEMFADFDLVTENSYGNRELYNNLLVHSNDDYTYDIYKVHRAVYSVFVENLLRYKLMLKADETIEDFNPLEQYKETTIHGERVRTDNIASRVDTTVHGNKTTTTNVGQSTDTNTAGERETDVSVTSFSSDTFKPTDKTVQPQTIDTVQYGARQDTTSLVQGNDTLTHGAHIDTITDGEVTDVRKGYKDGGAEIERLRTYAKQNTLKEIVNDVVNHISYGMYLF